MVGSASAVARLSGEGIDETKPYAELWMGTHPKAPLKLVEAAPGAAAGAPLSDFLRAHPAFAGRVGAGYDWVDDDSNPDDTDGHGEAAQVDIRLTLG